MLRQRAASWSVRPVVVLGGRYAAVRGGGAGRVLQEVCRGDAALRERSFWAAERALWLRQ